MYDFLIAIAFVDGLLLAMWLGMAISNQFEIPKIRKALQQIAKNITLIGK